MSASQEKKNRVVLRKEGNDKKANAAAEKEQKDRKFRRNAIIAAIIVVIVIAAAAVINSNLFYTKTPAVRIGDSEYSAAEVNCYYQMAYNTVYNQYYQMLGDYTSTLIDPSKPLNEQQYSEDQTWADYIWEVAQDNMKQITALYDDAMKNGYQLSAEDSETIEGGITSMQSYATAYGYENLNAFLAANYGGKGMNEKLYREILTKTTVAYSWAAEKENSFTFTDAELKDYYAANRDALDILAFDAYFIGGTDTAFAELDEAAQLTAAHDAAEVIAKATTPDEFSAAVQAYTGADSVVNVSYAQGQSLSATYADWLLSADRQFGDTTVIDADGGSYVLLFVERSDNNYNMVNMRHILVEAEADENGEYTTEALDAAQAEAEAIAAEWEANPTEENFAALANERSDDTGSNTNGGLYENVYRHNMVPAIDSFLFDSGAQPGDTAVVYGNNGGYAGYHVVYYAGEGGLFADYLADNQMRSESYTSYMEALEAPYSVTPGRGMKFTDLT